MKQQNSPDHTVLVPVRARRRELADRIAHRRLQSLVVDMRDQQPGRFRKWNFTCRCGWCQARKQDNIQRNAIKLFKRNGDGEAA